MAQEPILTARRLVKRYGRVTALDNADFDLYPNEILAVIGDNGAGKSTLIKAICGAVQPASKCQAMTSGSRSRQPERAATRVPTFGVAATRPLAASVRIASR